MLHTCPDGLSIHCEILPTIPSRERLVERKRVHRKEKGSSKLDSIAHMEFSDREPTDWDFVDAAGDWVEILCPYCFETVEILLESEVEGSLVQDCEVCCNPWQLRIRRGGGSVLEVMVESI